LDNAAGGAIRKTSAELLQEQIAASRQAARERLKAAQVSDAELRDLTEQARMRAGPAETDAVSAAIALPAAARLALAGGGSARVLNPKIWAEDVKRFVGRKLPTRAWLSRARQMAAKRQRGDVLRPTLVRACEVLAWGAQDGKIELTFDSLANLVGCCRETARKVIRWLEDVELIDTFNVLVRTTGKLVRGANLYLPRLSAADEAAGDVASDDGEPGAAAGLTDPTAAAAVLGPVARLTARLARWAPRFELVERAWGLNATPLSSRHYREDPSPAPA
jgi:hypothetical protein